MNLAEVRAKERGVMDIVGADFAAEYGKTYSDTLANGSVEDNNRAEEEDENDWNVDDVGFENLFKGHYGFA